MKKKIKDMTVEEKLNYCKSRNSCINCYCAIWIKEQYTVCEYPICVLYEPKELDYEIEVEGPRYLR